MTPAVRCQNLFETILLFFISRLNSWKHMLVGFYHYILLIIIVSSKYFVRKIIMQSGDRQLDLPTSIVMNNCLKRNIVTDIVRHNEHC